MPKAAPLKKKGWSTAKGQTTRKSEKPEGYNDIEEQLEEFKAALKDAHNASHDGKKKYEMTWPIAQIHHQRNRWIYEMYYQQQTMSEELYKYLVKMDVVDTALIAKWKKQGYEKVSAPAAYLWHRLYGC